MTDVSCRGLNREKKKERQLFLSRHVVADGKEFDGGVLVDENGIISGVYTRETLKDLSLENDGTLQVNKFTQKSSLLNIILSIILLFLKNNTNLMFSKDKVGTFRIVL